MKEVVLDGLPTDVNQAAIQSWFYEEGDAVTQGDELAEIATDDSTYTIQAPCSGILLEVYFDEGENIDLGEIICAIDDEEV